MSYAHIALWSIAAVVAYLAIGTAYASANFLWSRFYDECTLDFSYVIATWPLRAIKTALGIAVGRPLLMHAARKHFAVVVRNLHTREASVYAETQGRGHTRLHYWTTNIIQILDNKTDVRVWSHKTDEQNRRLYGRDEAELIVRFAPVEWLKLLKASDLVELLASDKEGRREAAMLALQYVKPEDA